MCAEPYKYEAIDTAIKLGEALNFLSYPIYKKILIIVSYDHIHHKNLQVSDNYHNNLDPIRQQG
ncbi:MAG: hypothetical protein ACFFBE_03090 [Promethearchaeota archaeon]